MTTVALRLASTADAEAIMAIYNSEVLGSRVTFDLVARSLAAQRAWIADHQGAHPAVVALSGDVVAGFGSLSPYRPRPAYSTTVEDSVYVHAEHRREGIGAAVLQELVRLATLHGFHAVIARIAGGQQASVRLHQACGFAVVGTEREVGRKFGQWLDVCVMETLLGQPGPGDQAP